MNKRICLSIFVSTLLTGCMHTLEVSKYSPSTEVTRGLAYNLQFTQFEVKVTRSIANCNSPVADDIPDVKAMIKAEITAHTVDDGDYTYVIKADSLNGLTRVSNLTVKWDGGRLVSVNSAAEDKTADIITSVATGIGKLAISAINPLGALTNGVVNPGVVESLPLDGSPPPFIDDSPVPVVKCKDSTIAFLEEVTRNEGEIKRLSEVIARLGTTIAQQEEDLTRIGRNPSLTCTDPATANNVQCLLATSVASLRTSEADLKAATTALGRAFTRISHVVTYRWPEDSATMTSDAFSLSPVVIGNWLEDSTAAATHTIPAHQQSIANFRNQFDVLFRINKIGSYGRTDLAASYKDDLGAEGGVRYRLPANGYLTVCKVSMCDRGDSDRAVATMLNPIQQFGHVFSLPFISKPFSNATLALTFDEQGRPKEATIASLEAPLENVSSAFNGVVDQIVAYRAAENAANPDKTELEELQDELALLNARAALATAQDTFDGSNSLANLRDETALLEQEKLYLDALAARDAALPTGNGATQQEIAMINSESSLILAEAALLQARLTLRNAQEALGE